MISFSDEKLREIAQLFSGRNLYRHDLVNFFFCTLADTPYFINTRRFNLGLLSLLPTLAVKRLKSRNHPVEAAIQEKFDYLFCILGDVSKEQDTLLPVISALRERNESVLVIWLRSTPVPEKTLSELNGATVFIPGTSGEMAGSFRGFVDDTFNSLSILFRGCYLLRKLDGWGTAFSPRGAWLFEQIFHLLRWERYFSHLLSNQTFRETAVVSETAVVTLAICHVAIDNKWSPHHYLHGLPGLLHTRSLSHHIYCFSSAERNYFIRNGWDPSQVHADGHPRQNRFIQKIRQLRTLEPQEGGLRILFASQPSIDGMGFYSDEYTAIQQAVIGVAERLGLGPEDLRIRLHPIENDKRFIEIAAERSLPEARSLLSNKSIEEDLAWANVVLTIASTVSIETAYSGGALIWLRFGRFHYEVREELCDEGFGLSVSTEEELYQELTRLQDPTYRRIQIAKFLDTARALSVITPQRRNHSPHEPTGSI